MNFKTDTFVQTLILLFIFIFPSLSFAFSIKIVPVSQICMVMDKEIDTNSIPVKYDEDFTVKTYYVSSEDCVYRIKTDSFVHRAIDPVTKFFIFKADAIVGIDADGNMNYFSSWDTLNTFLNSKK